MPLMNCLKRQRLLQHWGLAKDDDNAGFFPCKRKNERGSTDVNKN
ncbi:hypothetical protein [Bartonella sp. AC134YNZD]